MNVGVKSALIAGVVALTLFSAMPLVWQAAAGSAWGGGVMGPGMMGSGMTGPRMMGRAPGNTGGDAQSAPPVATAAVAIRGFAFAPVHIKVSPGTTVTWTNQDSVAHTITSSPGNELNSPLVGNGQTFSHTFASPGTYAYHCAPHPWMTGVVTVE